MAGELLEGRRPAGAWSERAVDIFVALFSVMAAVGLHMETAAVTGGAVMSPGTLTADDARARTRHSPSGGLRRRGRLLAPPECPRPL